MLIGVGPLTRGWVDLPGATFLKKTDSVSHTSLTVSSSSVRVGGLCVPPILMLECWYCASCLLYFMILAWHCIHFCWNPHLLWSYECFCPFIPKSHSFATLFPDLCCLQSFAPSSVIFTANLRKMVWYGHLICGWAIYWPYSLHVDQLKVPAFTVVYYVKKLLSV